MSSLPFGIVRQAVTAGLVVRARALHRGVVLRDVEIDRPRPQRARSSVDSASSSCVAVRPVVALRQQAILGRVVAQREEQVCAMSAWKPSVFGRSTISSSCDHPLPAVHAAPADLAFRGEPLAVALGDVARLAERLGDPLRVALRIRRPVRRARRRVDADRRRTCGCRDRAASCRSRTPCAPASGTSCDPRRSPSPSRRRSAATPARPASRRRSRARATLSRSRFSSSSVASMLMCGSNRNRSTPSNLTPSTFAFAVRSSIVSRSMDGSAPGLPFPTRPGHMALCSAGREC